MIHVEQRLSPEEQRTVLVQLGKLVREYRADAARPAVVDFRQVGTHAELAGHNSATPAELADLFVQLRKGMYAEGRGTWLQARFTLAPDGTFDFDFALDDNPVWTEPPPSAAYPEELAAWDRALALAPDQLGCIHGSNLPARLTAVGRSQM